MNNCSYWRRHARIILYIEYSTEFEIDCKGPVDCKGLY